MSEQISKNDVLPDGALVSNRYRIERQLGRGGMATVYLASDVVLQGSKVAIKVLHPSLCQDGDLTKRFLREVQLMNKVNNPNVVRTFDIGRDASTVYFTMEYLEGNTLEDLIRGKQLPISTVCKLANQMAAALEAIHSHEIVHRDLKPANIMVLKDFSIKLTDFGIARPKNSDLTQHNEIIGSVNYMAPEVWLGKNVSPAVDIYSLGVILYEMLTGACPFQADEPANLMWMHIKQPPTPPKTIRSDIPAWLSSFVLRMLAKSAKDRPNSSSEIQSYIGSHIGRPTGVSEDNSPTQTGSFSSLTSGSHTVQQQQSGVTGRRTRSRGGRRGSRATAIAGVGASLIAGTYFAMPWLAALVEDLFPV